MIEEPKVPTWKDKWDEAQLEILDLKQKVELAAKANKDEIAALVKEIQQCWQDVRYACRAFGNQDWLIRRHEELCDVLKKYGIEVPRKL